ncbi:MAG: transketolase, partial [Lachnospiraceae bacterium]|nr:transketolase [Lachnospiraceae bacterium]
MDYKVKGKELRRDIVKMLHTAKSGHPGGSLSELEILIALYYEVMNIDPKNPQKEDRDLFVLSKGHACPGLYAVLADKGYFPKDDLWTLRKIDSMLQGHPDSHKTKGIDVNAGSLGQGASVSVGLALAAKRKNNGQKVYCLLGDGECQEGLVWEAAMSASHYKLDNLTFILDNNGLQIDGKNDEVMSLGNIKEKFSAFGFKTFEVDGHNVEEIVKALKENVSGQPKFIQAHTIKGKGIS